ncbi:transcriptional regulator [Veronia nyctiphanis]|uniref:Transcriptional regulator n=1 Tax=Veronia nyctiphanis TaxID=1278244 RepID=A0A4Q0YQ58_9GAMM|nr:helix-turn-helix domain-containing protein [Veronia nyctiphanis]RXJ72144.1 transcriptional regulator [Veronia nyctiphanis]
MSIPYPNSPVRGSQTGKPIMALFDLLGRTWALGIIWQLSFGSATFRELQQRCENISPTLLNNRIKELRALELMSTSDDGYQLTELGNELVAFIKPLGDWSYHWADNIQNNNNKERSED